MRRVEKITSIEKVFIYLYFPFLSLYDAFRSKPFSIPFVYLFLASSIEVQSKGPDINRMFEKLQKYFNGGSFETLYSELIQGYWLLEKVDFIEDICLFLVSLLTGNQRLGIVLLSLIQGLLMLNLLKQVSKLWSMKHLNKIGLVLFSLLFLIVLNPIFSLNQFRFWTATLFILNGITLYLKENKLFWLWLFLGGLTHFSLFLVFAFILVSISFGRMFNYWILFFTLLACHYIDFSVLLNSSSELLFVQGEYQHRALSYLGDAGLNYRNQRIDRVFYANWQEISFILSQSIFLLLPIFSKGFKGLNYAKSLLFFNILLVCIDDFPMFFRFAIIGVLINLGVLIFYISRNLTIYRLSVFLILASFPIIMSISFLQEFLTYKFLVNNILTAYFIYDWGT